MIRQMTRQKFIEIFRPDGKGHIGFQTINENGETETIWEESFDEVICDKCNGDITQPIDENGNVDEDVKTIFYDEDTNYVLCENCYRCFHGRII